MKGKSLLLQCHQLSVGYRHRSTATVLFEGLNLSLTAGEMICFMGPNGAGKSSILRTLAGLQQPLAGEVVLQGNLERARHIAVVLTERIAAPQLTVAEVITFGRYPYLGWNLRLTNHDQERIHDAIDRVHLRGLLHKRINTLSDGQLQMVLIARALAQDTPIILLDEPTTHLDLNNRLEIMNLLRTLAHDSGKAVLLTTHDLDLALQTADKIWLAHPGRGIYSGWPEDLVLNGSFDEIFQMKGFDLKTGKVQHPAYRNIRVQLLGDGPAWWWTKNALERQGYSVSTENADISVTVTLEANLPKWKLHYSGNERQVSTIEDLMDIL